MSAKADECLMLELTAEKFPYSTSRLQEEMNVTDADIRELRKKVECSVCRT